MKIVVCPLSKAAQQAKIHQPERVASLLDPGFDFPDFGPSYRERHLQLSFHDTHDTSQGQVPPQTMHAEKLLNFLSSWTGSAPLLIHCRAGIGRSSAAAFIAACLHQPKLGEWEIARSLRSLSPLARPNELLIECADRAMGRRGLMLQAIRQTGGNLGWIDVDENIPFEWPLGRIGT